MPLLTSGNSVKEPDATADWLPACHCTCSIAPSGPCPKGDVIHQGPSLQCGSRRPWPRAVPGAYAGFHSNLWGGWGKALVSCHRHESVVIICCSHKAQGSHRTGECFCQGRCKFRLSVARGWGEWPWLTALPCFCAHDWERTTKAVFKEEEEDLVRENFPICGLQSGNCGEQNTHSSAPDFP